MTKASTVRRSPPTCLPQDRRLRLCAILLLMLAPLAFGTLALFLGEDMSWDFRNYHWYNAYAFMTGRTASGIDLMPSQFHAFFNPLLDVPFYLLGARLPPKAAFFILGEAQGLNFILIFLLAHLSLPEGRNKTLLCAGLAALGMISGIGLAEIGTAFNDNLTSLGILLSAVLVLRYRGALQSAPAARALMLAVACGIPAGMMAGLKITCLPFCAALFFALPAAVKHRWPIWIALGAGLAAGFIVTYGYWGYYLDAHYGSPTFPLFNDIFRSPLFPHVPVRDEFYILQNTHPLLLPFRFALNPRLVSEVPWRDWRIPILYVLMPVMLASRLFSQEKNTTPDGGYLLWLGAISYVLWMAAFCIYRYLLPLDMIAPLLIVLCCGMMPARGKTRVALAAILLALVALSVRPGNFGRLPTWPEHIFSVNIPTLPNTGDTMILMTGTDAVGYIASLFPPHIPFVRIDGRTFHAEDGESNAGINYIVREKINGHHGRLMLLMLPSDRAAAEKQLAYFGLRFSGGACGKVTDLLRPRDFPPEDFPAEHVLCGVRPSPGRL